MSNIDKSRYEGHSTGLTLKDKPYESWKIRNAEGELVLCDVAYSNVVDLSKGDWRLFADAWKILADHARLEAELTALRREVAVLKRALEEPSSQAILDDCQCATGPWRYVGTRFPLQSPQGDRIQMHVISVPHPNGEWEAVYCETEAQARLIVETVNAAIGGK